MTTFTFFFSKKQRTNQVFSYVLYFVVLLQIGIATTGFGNSLPNKTEVLTLEQCLLEVLLNNPTIQVQRNELQRAEGEKLTYYSNALPKLAVQVNAGILGEKDAQDLVEHYVIINGNPVLVPEGFALRPRKAYLTTSETFVQPLFNLAIPYSISRGRWGVRVAEQNFYVTAVTILNAARISFNNALFHFKLKHLYERIARLTQENANLMQAQFSAEEVSQSSLLQAQIQAFNIKPSVIRAQNAYDSNLLQLLTLMGRDTGYKNSIRPTNGEPNADLLSHIKLAGNFPNVHTLKNFDVNLAIQAALKFRPDLNSLRASIRSASADAGIAFANYFPTINLIVDGNYIPTSGLMESKPSLRPGDTTLVTSVNYGANMNWRVIDNGSVTGTLQSIKAGKEILITRLHFQETTIPRELVKNHDRINILLNQQKVLDQSRQAATQAFNLVNQSVQNGVSSQYDFINANNAFLNNRLQLLSSEYSAANTLAEIDRLTGGYLNFIINPR